MIEVSFSATLRPIKTHVLHKREPLLLTLYITLWLRQIEPLFKYDLRRPIVGGRTMIVLCRYNYPQFDPFPLYGIVD